MQVAVVVVGAMMLVEEVILVLSLLAELEACGDSALQSQSCRLCHTVCSAAVKEGGARSPDKDLLMI